MKKILLLLICCVEILSLSFCTGCKTTLQYRQEQAEIVSVEIVSLKYIEKDKCLPEEILICKIENVTEFLNELSAIDTHSVSPPTRSSTFKTPTVVQITYRDGEKERIAPTGQMTYLLNGYHLFNGTLQLDAEQFAALIEKYVGKEPIKLEYNFLHRESEISAVEIVTLGESTSQDSVPEEQTTICVIEDIPGFLRNFSEVDCFLNKKAPTKVQDNTTVFKVSYGDMGYELIGVNGQSKSYVHSGMLLNGYRYFDENQFAELVLYYCDQQ